jgi:hypothetical protein
MNSLFMVMSLLESGGEATRFPAAWLNVQLNTFDSAVATLTVLKARAAAGFVCPVRHDDFACTLCHRRASRLE